MNVFNRQYHYQYIHCPFEKVQTNVNDPQEMHNAKWQLAQRERLRAISAKRKRSNEDRLQSVSSFLIALKKSQ